MFEKAKIPSKIRGIIWTERTQRGKVKLSKTKFKGCALCFMDLFLLLSLRLKMEKLI